MKIAREAWIIAERILLELLRRRRSLIFWSGFPVVVHIFNALILAERLQISDAEAFAQAAPPPWSGRPCSSAAWAEAWRLWWRSGSSAH